MGTAASPLALDPAERLLRRPRRSRSLTFWAVAASALVLDGVAASLVGARLVANDRAAASRLAFHNSAQDVADALQLAIQREQDLVVNGAAFMARNPHALRAQFLEWSTSISALTRYPELEGMGFVTVVPRDRLAAFAARIDATQPAGSAPYTVSPAGKRPFYCLGVVGFSRIPVGASAGLDYCASHATTISARDTGQGAYYPVALGFTTWLGIDTPVYRGGVTPSTVAARRERFLGWLGEAIDPHVLLNRALQGRTGTAVKMQYAKGGSTVVFASADAPHPAATSTIDLRNGWTVSVTGPLPAAGVFGN
jgi:hypothetical protein